MKKAYKKLNFHTRKWIRKVQSKFDLEEHHNRLLVLAGQCWDRAQDARAVIDSEGAIIEDRFLQKKPHPAVEIERASIVTFTRVLRELGLDLVTPEDSRPKVRPGGY